MRRRRGSACGGEEEIWVARGIGERMCGRGNVCPSLF